MTSGFSSGLNRRRRLRFPGSAAKSIRWNDMVETFQEWFFSCLLIMTALTVGYPHFSLVMLLKSDLTRCSNPPHVHNRL